MYVQSWTCFARLTSYWFSADVTVAMLVDKKKRVSLGWELNFLVYYKLTFAQHKAWQQWPGLQPTEASQDQGAGTEPWVARWTPVGAAWRELHQLSLESYVCFPGFPLSAYKYFLLRIQSHCNLVRDSNGFKWPATGARKCHVLVNKTGLFGDNGISVY